MSKLNLVRNGFTRRADEDFYDDGSWFRAYEYEGKIVTVCKYENTYFVHVRTWDHGHQFTDSDWYATPESRLADEFNGVPVVDVEKLKANIRTINAKMDELEAQVTNQSIDTSRAVSALDVEIDMARTALNTFKSQYNWFEAQPCELKHYVEYAHRLEDKISNAEVLRKALAEDILDLKAKRTYMQGLDRNGYIQFSKDDFYITELVEALA